MFLRLPNVFVIVIILFPVVHNFLLYSPKSKRLVDTLKNISRVSNELQDLLEIYMRLERESKLSEKGAHVKPSEYIENSDENFEMKIESNLFKQMLAVTPSNTLKTDTKKRKKEEAVTSLNKNKNAGTTKKYDPVTKPLKKSIFNSYVREHDRKALVNALKNNATHYIMKDIQSQLNDAKFLVIQLARSNMRNTERYRPSISKGTDMLPINEKILKSRTMYFDDSDSEEEKEMQNEILKASALRQAYGEACTVLVVRKCKKALRATLHDVCRKSDRKCTWQFENDFRNHAISACFYQFLNKTISPYDNRYNNYDDGNNYNNENDDNDNNSNNNSDMNKDTDGNDKNDEDDKNGGDDKNEGNDKSGENNKRNGNSDQKDKSDGNDKSGGNKISVNRKSRDTYPEQHAAGFIDVMRQGYIDTACLRTLAEDIQPEEADPPAIDSNAKEVKLLRTNYEKACRKSSYSKCYAAGKFASDKACATHNCVKLKKRLLKKSYTKRCGEIYGYRVGSSESDE